MMGHTAVSEGEDGSYGGFLEGRWVIRRFLRGEMGHTAVSEREDGSYRGF